MWIKEKGPVYIPPRGKLVPKRQKTFFDTSILFLAPLMQLAALCPYLSFSIFAIYHFWPPTHPGPRFSFLFFNKTPPPPPPKPRTTFSLQLVTCLYLLVSAFRDFTVNSSSLYANPIRRRKIKMEGGGTEKMRGSIRHVKAILLTFGSGNFWPNNLELYSIDLFIYFPPPNFFFFSSRISFFVAICLLQ